ncbi:MAG: hypothetical protein AcusKO_18710 [Acuticoccus sp.]
MNARKGPAPQRSAPLGDPQSVRELLALVTGGRVRAGRGGGGVPAVAVDAAGSPSACPLRGGGGVLLTVERTPREIRALRDEGIIGAC